MTMKENQLSDPDKRDYIHSLVDDLESDKKSVLLYIAFEFGLIAITITKRYPLEEIMPWLVLISLIFLFFSSYLFFNYFRKLHCSRLEITSCLIELDIEEAHRIAKDDKSGIWKLYGWKYNWGKYLLYIGVILYVIEMLMFRLYPSILP